MVKKSPYWASSDAAFAERIQMQAKFGRLDTKPIIARDVLDTVFKQAPNAVEWLGRTDFVGNDRLYDYKRSYQVVRDFFQLRCPLCNDSDPRAIDAWDKSREYLQSEVLLVWNEEYGEDVCPKCRNSRSDLRSSGLILPYDGIHLVAGMRSGKTFTLAGIASFMTHWLLCRGFREKGGLTQYFGLGVGTKFEFSFVAASKDQSDDTAWALFQNQLRGAPWYRRFREWILAEERKQPPGEKNWVFADNDAELRIEHPLIRTKWVALATQSETSAGRTRLCSVVDEMGRMLQNAGGKQSARHVYGTQEDSLQTIRAKVKARGLPSWLGSIMSCTSRRHRDGYEIKLYEKREELPNMYMMLCPTWEFNPDVTLEMLADKFIKDYATAMLHFGCVVVEDEEMLVSSVEEFIPALVRPKIKPTMRFNYGVYVDGSGDELSNAVLAECLLQDTYAAAPDSPRVIAIDNGQTWDCLTMTCAHGVWAGDGDNQEYVTVYDWMIRLVPKDDRKVRLVAVIELIRAAAKNYRRLYEARFDRWESATQIEILRDDGINATRGKSPNAAEIRAFRGAVSCGRVWMPAPSPDDYATNADGWFESPLKQLRSPAEMSPFGAALSELLRLKDDGVRIYNSEKGRVRGVNSDDAALTLVRAHTMVQRLGHVDDAEARGHKANKKRSEWQQVKPHERAQIWQQSPARSRAINLIRPEMPLGVGGTGNGNMGGFGGARGTGYGSSAGPGFGIFGNQQLGSVFGPRGSGNGRGGHGGGRGGF